MAVSLRATSARGSLVGEPASYASTLAGRDSSLVTAMNAGANRRIDVLIGGGGFAGLALAIALRQALGPSFAVAVADPALGRPPADARASAIVAAARRLFETIGVWDAVADDAQPILDMVITDSRLQDAVRPVFLTFDGDVAPGEPFAPHGRERAAARGAGREGARPKASSCCPVACRDFRRDVEGETRSRVDARPDGEPTISARLLVAADGARSAIRERAGIATHGWGYGQSASSRPSRMSAIMTAAPRSISCRPARSRSCRSRRRRGHRSSIVWTEDKREAERIVALPDAEFHAELERRFGLQLGEIEAVGPRRAFPLGFAVARSFVAERIALVGDAAHVIHPIAGQGLNMGLKDVAALAEVIVDAARLGLDPGGARCSSATSAGGASTPWRWGLRPTGSTGCSPTAPTRCGWSRDVGLGLVDRLPALKQLVHPRGRGPGRRCAEAAARRGAVDRRREVMTRSFPRKREIQMLPVRCSASGSRLSRGRAERTVTTGEMTRVTSAAPADLLLEGWARRDRRVPASRLASRGRSGTSCTIAVGS